MHFAYSLLIMSVRANFDPERLLPSVKIGLSNFLIDQFDKNVIQTEIKVKPTIYHIVYL